MHPDLRVALKRVHPGLTDAQIDEYEALLAQRFLFDPETQQADIRNVDRRLEEVIRRYMPQFAQVAQDFAHGRTAGGGSPGEALGVARPLVGSSHTRRYALTGDGAAPAGHARAVAGR